VRKELGIKTFFNMLGPIVNPAMPRYQLTGVYSLELARQYHYIFQKGDKQYAVIHNLDGYDECSLTAPLKIYRSDDELLLHPDDFGYSAVSPDEILGRNDTSSNAAIFLDILKNRGTAAQENVVLANAALAIRTMSGKSLDQSLDEARHALKSGKAYETFKRLIQIQA
jgi:anthranilate phosphoribosyltransferase